MKTSSIVNIALKNVKITDILKPLLGIFAIPDVPVPPIEPTSILSTVSNPGLSPRKMAIEVISRKSEAGAPTGPLPSGADSIDEKMEIIRMQEIVKGLQQDARITVAIPPGITVTGFVVGPVPTPIVAVTTSPIHLGYAVMQ